jgi:hypothetical protein
MNIVPALLLWAVASLLLILYYTAAPVADALNAFAKVKAQLGLLFVMPAQALAAGFLPYLFQKLQRGVDHVFTSLKSLILWRSGYSGCPDECFLRCASARIR